MIANPVFNCLWIAFGGEKLFYFLSAMEKGKVWNFLLITILLSHWTNGNFLLLFFNNKWMMNTENLNDKTTILPSRVGDYFRLRQLQVLAVSRNYHIHHCKLFESIDHVSVLTTNAFSWPPCVFHHSLTHHCCCHHDPMTFVSPWQSHRGFFPALLKINLTFSWNN